MDDLLLINELNTPKDFFYSDNHYLNKYESATIKKQQKKFIEIK